MHWRALLYVATALRLAWLLGADAFYYYDACRQQRQHCEDAQHVTDNAAFWAACRQLDALGTPLTRSAHYVAARCLDTSNDVLPYLLVAVLLSVLLPRFYRDWLLPYCARRRLQVENYKYRQYVAGRKVRQEGLNIEL
jgi:hypothetical protein